MAIVVKLGDKMKEKHIKLNELADEVGITNVNLSRLKTGKAIAVRFSTLNEICRALDCKPGDILDYKEDRY